MTIVEDFGHDAPEPWKDLRAARNDAFYWQHKALTADREIAELREKIKGLEKLLASTDASKKK